MVEIYRVHYNIGELSEGSLGEDLNIDSDLTRNSQIGQGTNTA